MRLWYGNGLGIKRGVWSKCPNNIIHIISYFSVFVLYILYIFVVVVVVFKYITFMCCGHWKRRVTFGAIISYFYFFYFFRFSSAYIYLLVLRVWPLNCVGEKCLLSVVYGHFWMLNNISFCSSFVTLISQLTVTSILNTKYVNFNALSVLFYDMLNVKRTETKNKNKNYTRKERIK